MAFTGNEVCEPKLRSPERGQVTASLENLDKTTHALVEAMGNFLDKLIPVSRSVLPCEGKACAEKTERVPVAEWIDSNDDRVKMALSMINGAMDRLEL